MVDTRSLGMCIYISCAKNCKAPSQPSNPAQHRIPPPSRCGCVRLPQRPTEDSNSSNRNTLFRHCIYGLTRSKRSRKGRQSIFGAVHRRHENKSANAARGSPESDAKGDRAQGHQCYSSRAAMPTNTGQGVAESTTLACPSPKRRRPFYLFSVHYRGASANECHAIALGSGRGARAQASVFRSLRSVSATALCCTCQPLEPPRSANCPEGGSASVTSDLLRPPLSSLN